MMSRTSLQLVVLALAAAGASALANNRAASTSVNCQCQCSSRMFRDRSGRLQGNCRRADRSGALWCYVDSRQSRCGDKQRSQRFRRERKFWSYEACATPSLNSPQCSYQPVCRGASCGSNQPICRGSSCGSGLHPFLRPSGSGTSGKCKDGYRVYPGDKNCCDSSLKPARCCHQPGSQQIFCT